MKKMVHSPGTGVVNGAIRRSAEGATGEIEMAEETDEEHDKGTCEDQINPSLPAPF
ncbi:MAG: hypothetical protein AB9866_07295 [Syntrophobacteraceae bacterium]